MTFKQLLHLTFLSGITIGTSSVNAANQNSTGFLIDIGPTPNELTLRNIAKEKSLPVIIIATHAYLPPIECIGNRMLAGDTENRELAGDSENRELAGDSENRELAGDSGNRELAGSSENRELAGDLENREIAGNAENRELAGNSENRDLDGDSENRELAGNSENRSLSGDKSNLKCYMTPAGFAVIYHNKENIMFYDGKQYFKNSIEYKF